MVKSEFEMYGVENIAAFALSVKDSLTFKTSGISMVLMSLMSDAQEQMAHGNIEDARQTLNRTKFLVHMFVAPAHMR